MTATYYGSAKFKASRARTAKRRYWRDPEKARQRLRDYRARKRAAGAAAMRDDRDLCSACRQSFDGVPQAPMLFDGSWRKLAHPRELLCADCFFAREVQRRICITLADLRPCPVNLFHRPRSWFDLFAKDEAAEVVEAWLKMAQRHEESWKERRKQWEREAARDD
jgi:hypothetical protein